MATSKDRRRIEAKGVVIGYAMSRFDTDYLEARGHSTWMDAYREASKSLGVPPNSFKNLRDEFDPFHANLRAGWHRRPLRGSRERVLEELGDVSDDAVLELVNRIVAGDEIAISEAIDSLTASTGIPANVAERLLTGRRAEEYFMSNVANILSLPEPKLLDMRLSAEGYDFGLKARPEIAIEVKGLKGMRGQIQFTDKEWSEAERRRSDYWLVVVGNLASKPKVKLFEAPRSTLTATSSYRSSLTISWNAKVSLSA